MSNYQLIKNPKQLNQLIERLQLETCIAVDTESDSLYSYFEKVCLLQISTETENFIIDPNGKLWLLDWEYGGMNDPYFDLGDFAVEHPLSAEQQELVIKTYCGENKYHRFCRMMLHQLTADLWWCQWAMIQDRISKIDFDFFTYGLGRYSRFRDNYYNRDFGSWLEAV